MKTEGSIENKETKRTKVRLRLSLKYLAVFFPLAIILGELHEQVHINTGWLICGGYGPRDFNAWKLSAECGRPGIAFLATSVGPLFSYAVIWTGALLLQKGRDLAVRTIGFTLIFAPLPFARIFTAAVGGGDEKVVLMHFFKDELGTAGVKLLAFIIVTSVLLPPMWIALKNIRNRFPILYVIGFSVLPLIFLSAYVLTFLNFLLAGGLLNEAPILGTPLLVLLHFGLMLSVLWFGRRWLLVLTRPKNKARELTPAGSLQG